MKQLVPAFLTTMGLALMATALVACTNDDCKVSNQEADQATVRNPQTGQCEADGPRPGNGGQCNDDFGSGADVSLPFFDYAFCGECEQFDEITCVETDSCRAIYNNGNTNGDSLEQPTDFVACWGTAPSGPVAGIECEGLDALSCSQTDHCAARHDETEGFFIACEDEKRACSSSSDCGGTDTCTTETEGACLAGPGCQFGDCDDSCWGFCTGPGNIDPGECVGEVACDEAEPLCPEGTVAGRDAACWTGFCIPIEACPMSDDCSSLSESECSLFDTCSGIYAGENCTCDGNQCSCESYRYEGCS